MSRFHRMPIEMPIHVLIVEDNTSDAFLLRMALSKSRDPEFTFTEVDRMSQAVSVLRTKKFHAIITDLNLPDTVGSETIQGLVKAAGGVPIIAMTGWEDRVLGAQLISQGASCYWSKDRIQDKDFTAAIVNLIGGHTTTGTRTGV